MRKVKLAAIQVDCRYPSPPYAPLGAGYVNDPGAIVEYFVKQRLQDTLDLVEQAGREGCDAVTTGEDATATSAYCVDTGATNIFPELLERSAPLADAALSALARKYSMVIVGCYNRRAGAANHNTATIFGRDGAVVGEYRKSHLPPDEKWQLTEGDALPVFDVDFGRIGVSICYDMMFPETVEALALQGAEVVFHPTAGYGWYDSIGEATLRTRANDNGIYIVTAKNYVHNGAGKSSVIDFWGQALADAGFHRNVVVSKTVDLDERKLQPPWYNPTQMSGIADVTARHLRERRPELYGLLARRLHPALPAADEDERRRIVERIKRGECRW